MNRGQQSRYFQDQEKRRTAASNIQFTEIGGNYSANVKAQNRASGAQYREIKGIGRNYMANIPNATPVGQKTRLIVTNNTWTTVTVSIRGWYRTN